MTEFPLLLRNLVEHVLLKLTLKTPLHVRTPNDSFLPHTDLNALLW